MMAVLQFLIGEHPVFTMIALFLILGFMHDAIAMRSK
jgi:hypothetical protein